MRTPAREDYPSLELLAAEGMTTANTRGEARAALDEIDRLRAADALYDVMTEDD